MKKIFLAAIALLFLACSQQSANKFSIDELATIASLQDKRDTDSLLLYLSHENNRFRQEAALAFASVQDSAAVEKLGKLLMADIDPVVRAYAALAIGQTPCKASEQVLLTVLDSEKDTQVLREVLEAIGKTASIDNASQLASYNTTDTLTETGKAAGFYRLGLRGIKSEPVVAAAYEMLGSENTEAQLMAAHFFARTSLPDFTDSKKLLAQASRHVDARIRMAATSGLRNVKSNSTIMLLRLQAKDTDERVRVSALRALRSFPFDKTQAIYFDALKDNSAQVQVAAAEAMNNLATTDAFENLKTEADKAANWRVQSTLYEIAASLKPSPELFKSIQDKYKGSANAYHKAALLNVLGRSVANATFVGNELIDNSDPILLSSAATALTACNSASDFSEKEKPAFLQWYKMAIEKGDAAVTGIIAQVIGDSTKQYKPLINDISFLKEARGKLSLPKDNESIQPLEAAIAYLEGRKAEPVVNTFNNPINWALVKTIPQKQQAIIKTTKGDITLELFIDEAPGSVSNFVTLARQNYFDGKFFHRVVPNFVIQAGCNRGDGYGSEDYSIRSEFTNRRYTTGSVGMASAGKDTEGTQWFITHSPTPHLDGRYTIFAEVRSGMDVVNAMEVGDKILDVVIQ